MRSLGIEFQTISAMNWLQLLRDYTSRDDVNFQGNPAGKLIDFYEEEYNEYNRGEFHFSTDMVQKHTDRLRSVPDIIKGGYMRNHLSNWMGQWTKFEHSQSDD